MVYLLHRTRLPSAVAILGEGFIADGLAIERGANFSLMETKQLREVDIENAHPWAERGCFMTFEWKGPIKIVESDDEPADSSNLLYDYPGERHFVRRTTQNLLYFLGATIEPNYLNDFPMEGHDWIRHSSRENVANTFFLMHIGQPVTVHLLPANQRRHR